MTSRLRVCALAALALLAACDLGALAPSETPTRANADARPLAVDIGITDIHAYQAVRVALVEDERAVTLANRRARVVAGRDLMLRVGVERPANALDRPLVALVDVGQQTYEQAVTFAKGATTADVHIEIAGADVTATVEYAVAIREAGSSPPKGDATRARWPRADGTTEALEAFDANGLAVVVVPYEYNGVAAPAVDAGRLASIVQAMYPLAEGGVTVTVDATESITASLNADPNSPYAAIFPSGHPFWISDEILADLRAKRTAAGTGAYYYGMIDNNTLFGIADGIPSPVSMGTDNDGIITFAHELGHNLGLRHAPCGGAGGPDPGFPYAGAGIGVEGYDPRTGAFLDEKTYKDFMSYCAPEWVSDYHFNRLHRQLSSTFALAPGAVEPDPVPCDFERELTR